MVEVLKGSVYVDIVRGRIRPDYWEAYYHLGYLYSDMGRNAEAIRMFEKAVKLKPNFPEIWDQLDRLKKGESEKS